MHLVFFQNLQRLFPIVGFQNTIAFLLQINFNRVYNFPVIVTNQNTFISLTSFYRRNYRLFIITCKKSDGKIPAGSAQKFPVTV